MKTLITIFLVAFSSFDSYCQKPAVSKEILNDFCTSFYYKYAYEKNENLQSMAYLTGNRIGYGLVDIEIAIEELGKNGTFREELFRTFADNSTHDQELLTLNFISIGMKAKNAKALSQYILDKYIVDPVKESRPESDVYTKVDEDAQFIGGDKALKDYLSDNFNYSDSAIKYGVVGKVLIQFTIDSNGYVSDAKIIEGNDLRYGVPEEALRVINSMPKWKPARQGQKHIRALRKQPFTFDLKPEKRNPDNSGGLPQSDSSKNSSEQYFIGTKKFCD